MLVCFLVLFSHPDSNKHRLCKYYPSVDERFSTLVETILPSFVSEKYPLFVDFIKAYYEWSEEYGNPRAEAVRINTYKDIDTTVDEFVQYFKSEYLFGFDSTVSEVEDEKLVKNIRDLYQEKVIQDLSNF